MDDYITTPQPTGYRGIHFIYRFQSQSALQACSGLKIEIQLRSFLQHAWATSVETAGMFTRQALKSSQGETDWLRFFELMGTVIAVKEDTPRVANTPLDNITLIEIRRSSRARPQYDGAKDRADRGAARPWRSSRG